MNPTMIYKKVIINNQNAQLEIKFERQNKSDEFEIISHRLAFSCFLKKIKTYKCW